MSHSLKITVPSECDYYTEETRNALVKLAKEIASHNKKVDIHEEARARVESDDIESVSAKDIFEGPASNNYRFDLYGKAVELCDKVKEFKSLHIADLRARYQEIVDQLEEWRVRIREGLTNLGYVAGDLHRDHVKSVDNFYRQHPAVLKLIHLELNFKHPRPLSGGDRAALVAGMANLRKRSLLS